MSKSRKPPTISDVAKLAGVSVGTVSNVLNNRASVSAGRARRVMRAVRELGFTGSMLAKGMRAQHNTLIGLCVPNTGFANFASLADTLDELSVADNFELIQVFSRYDAERELARIRRLIAYKAAGLLIVPSLQPQRVLDLVYEAGLPTVIINRMVPNETRFDQIALDHETGIVEVASRLLELGHKHIALAIQYPQLSVTQQRISSLTWTVEASGKGAKWSVLECGFESETFENTFAETMRSPERPTAIIASNDLLASWLIRAMHNNGIQCPKDMSLVVLEEPDWAELVYPKLSCFQQPAREIGRLAWDKLTQRINGEAGEPVTLRCAGKMVFRGSVAEYNKSTTSE
ncbi:LacI family transcriptional regulator [Hoeflea sp. WL0058]|uniref:LacI family transcriptional regulator n=1 Tax=Flavimaribacter sediminis TaxID=2865987 RepID=A0AAE3D026_9HYPH|nr:LacI family DNA-binding transcriptional regulator [Flavimaribacter sediminis]MBW8636338.1 LacI family transcriptional regulator [Flavimaribacter sediminis]